MGKTWAKLGARFTTSSEIPWPAVASGGMGIPGLTRVQIVVTDVLPATLAQPAMNTMRSRVGSRPVARQSSVNHFFVINHGGIMPTLGAHP